MGKTSSPVAQSAAAPFTPESESLRNSKTKVESTGAGSGWTLPSQMQASKESAAIENQLGESAHQSFTSGGSSRSEPQNQAQSSEHNSESSSQSRPRSYKEKLNLGWDKLLVTQKNICKKAMNLLSNMQATTSYFSASRAKSSRRRHQGIILDYRSDEVDENPSKKDAA